MKMRLILDPAHDLVLQVRAYKVAKDFLTPKNRFCGVLLGGKYFSIVMNKASYTVNISN
jgi:hypothetical protein